jgi:hypothetical protein
MYINVTGHFVTLIYEESQTRHYFYVKYSYNRRQVVVRSTFGCTLGLEQHPIATNIYNYQYLIMRIYSTTF